MIWIKSVLGAVKAAGNAVTAWMRRDERLSHEDLGRRKEREAATQARLDAVHHIRRIEGDVSEMDDAARRRAARRFVRGKPADED